VLPFQKSVLSRIVLSFFGLSSFIVLVLTVFSYSFFIKGAENRTIEQMEGFAAMKVQILDKWVDEQKADTVALSQVAEVVRDAEILSSTEQGKQEFMEARRRLDVFFKKQVPNYSEIKVASILTTIGGRIVFSTSLPREGQYRVLDTFYVEGKKGTHIQNVYPSTETLEPTITISTPIDDDNGNLVAVLAVDLDLDAIDRIIHDRTGLGQSGESYLVDRYNVFISGQRFGSPQDTLYPRGVHSAGIDAAVNGKNGSGLYLNYQGVPVIGVYRWIPDRESALIVEVRQDEAFQQARTQVVTLVLIGLGIAAAAAAAVFLLARQIASPIVAVQQAALKVSRGDLSAQAPVLTHDEIGELAKSFNQMTVTVKTLYDELKHEEEHYRSLIESSTDIIAVLDGKLCISYVSPSVKRVLGYDANELLGKDPFALVHPQDFAGLRSEGERLRSTGMASLSPIVFRMSCKTGSWRTMEAIGRNLLNHPAVSGIVLTIRDVTERQQLEERLIQAQKMEAVGRLAGGIAHDFNNLLTAVLGYSDVLLEENNLNEASRGYIAEIKKAANRAASLTQQLLAYSRKQMLQLKAVELNVLVNTMQDMLKRLIGEDIQLITRLYPESIRVKADSTQIEQVLMNLSINARDAMSGGGTIVFKTAKILIDGDALSRFPDLSPGPYAMLSVSDTGIGMDEETRKKIFDPFFTTKGVGKGTGLGLSTVFGIVKQSGGHITVDSELGRGTTFTIYLQTTAEAPAEQEGEATLPQVSNGNERVLVVEDEESVRKMIEMVLGQAGYRVHSEENPTAAKRFAETTDKIDLLVTDVILPGMNGRNLAESLSTVHPRMKVLFISGYTGEAIVHHGVLSEGIAFLKKPFLPKSLTTKVRDILDGR
jgi:PAS domain S-box-containing protein